MKQIQKIFGALKFSYGRSLMSNSLATDKYGKRVYIGDYVLIDGQIFYVTKIVGKFLFLIEACIGKAKPYSNSSSHAVLSHYVEIFD